MKLDSTPTLLLMALSLSVLGMGIAYAQPLEEVSATVLGFNGTSALVKLTWNHDDDIFRYESGCVSCTPNITKTIFDDGITLDGITAFSNGNALLYVIAYDENSEISYAKQIMVKLN